MEKLKHAFAVGPDPREERGLPESLERLARLVVERGMETPAIIALESVVPLSFLGSQAAHAAWPIVRLLTDKIDVGEVAEALEDRATIRRFTERIEELAAGTGAS